MSLKDNKICLIIPPSPFLLDERVIMHIGVLKVAASLEAKGYRLDCLDLAGVDDYYALLTKYLEENDTVVFGLTATTPQMPHAMKIAEHLKEKKPNIKIILGGTHVSLMNSARKKEEKKGTPGRATVDIEKLKSVFDTLVCGDGEHAIFEALKFKDSIVDADDKTSPLFLNDEDFSELPFPSRHLVDVDSYHYEIDGKRATSLICQLGCPFRCTFCGGRNSPFLRKIRTRSSDSIIEEMKHLYDTYGFTGYMFYDDELNVNKEWETLLEKIAGLQRELGETFHLRGFVKAELFSQRQADLMYAAGFRWLLTGFESGDERILVNIDKNATLEDNTRCVEYAKEAGLKVKALMSVGHAGESHESVKNSKDWLLQVKPEDFDCTIISTYPGSPYFDDAVIENGVYTYTSPKTGDKLFQKDLDYFKDPDYYKGDPSGGYISYVWTEHISPEELVDARDALENEVREVLAIPFNPAGGKIKFEHSMGQGNIPTSVLRSNY
jgi:anaerobic magnesium-protoporphyrin IX monomethyl ester cyclase